jgi:hypothetical protein
VGIVCGHDGGVAARDLLVRFGDRVSVAGRYVRREDGDWLDLARVSDLMFHPADWKSSNSVRVLGLDSDAIPEDFGPDNSIVRGWALVTGVWRDDTIYVDSQGTVDRPVQIERPSLACSPPIDGWDTDATSTDVPELEFLRASGAIVCDGWFQDVSGALLLRVAASDVQLVNRVLGPRLPRRLCVVASRFTAEEVRRVQEGFDAHHHEWLFETWSVGNLDAEGQPFAFAELLRVTDHLANWADTIPDGLLDLRPTMIPA